MFQNNTKKQLIGLKSFLSFSAYWLYLNRLATHVNIIITYICMSVFFCKEKAPAVMVDAVDSIIVVAEHSMCHVYS